MELRTQLGDWRSRILILVNSSEAREQPFNMPTQSSTEPRRGRGLETRGELTRGGKPSCHKLNQVM